MPFKVLLVVIWIELFIMEQVSETLVCCNQRMGIIYAVVVEASLDAANKELLIRVVHQLDHDLDSLIEWLAG